MYKPSNMTNLEYIKLYGSLPLDVQEDIAWKLDQYEEGELLVSEIDAYPDEQHAIDLEELVKRIYNVVNHSKSYKKSEIVDFLKEISDDFDELRSRMEYSNEYIAEEIYKNNLAIRKMKKGI